MLFSLIVATLGKSSEIISLLDSLSIQAYREFELLVVDQNKDDRIFALLSHYHSRFPIEYLKTTELGLSKARNLGISYAKGDIFGFPDDDCWYPQELLSHLKDFFSENLNIHGVTGRVVDEKQENIARFASQPGKVGPFGVWTRSSSVSIFLRKEVIGSIGRFDETLGVGAGTFWRGGEDIDYPLRAIRAGFNLYYDPQIRVFHPRINFDDSDSIMQRAYYYGAGIGRVWKKHDFPFWLVIYHLLRPLGGCLWALARADHAKARYYWSSFKGRLRGWRSK